MIDSHHHFWRYNAKDFSWITDDMAVLKQDFLPPLLEETIAGTGITGVITVQARSSLAETEWLLSLAAQNPWIRGVVGWVPLKDPSIGAVLDRLHANPHFRGVRDVIPEGPDAPFFESPEIQRGMGELASRGLSYDLLVPAHQLDGAIRFVDANPRLRFVLDHIGSPEIRKAWPNEWARQIRELAKRQNVFCKFSGVPNEVLDGKWSVESLRPYFETVLEAFGSRRLMFGSNWPVCLLRTGYARWLSAVKELARPLSVHERRSIFCETARVAYDLKR